MQQTTQRTTQRTTQWTTTRTTQRRTQRTTKRTTQADDAENADATEGVGDIQYNAEVYEGMHHDEHDCS